jgi:hypothetical protein
MNKPLIILGIAVLLICVGLSGCFGDSLGGTWSGKVYMDGWLGSDRNIIEITFKDDNIYFKTDRNIDFSGTYFTQNGKIYIEYHTSLGSSSLDYDYRISGGILYLDNQEFTKI